MLAPPAMMVVEAVVDDEDQEQQQESSPKVPFIKIAKSYELCNVVLCSLSLTGTQRRAGRDGPFFSRSRRAKDNQQGGDMTYLQNHF